jgi:hypothetical protein
MYIPHAKVRVLHEKHSVYIFAENLIGMESDIVFNDASGNLDSRLSVVDLPIAPKSIQRIYPQYMGTHT